MAATSLDSQAVHLLRCAHKRASALFVAELGEKNLTPAQYLAITRLYDLKRVSQNQLGRMTAMDPATIQGVVQRLMGRGLVERHPDENDRRRVMLCLTSAGRAAVEEIKDQITAINDRILQPLSRGEREHFIRLLRRLG
ncbi:MAG: MarR family transcriptional regulator [Kiloniellales bacterium]|nr:MarR family transcriptional regulator [Kiloniellales bacterium]